MDEATFELDDSPGDFLTVEGKLAFDPDPLPPSLDASHELTEAVQQTAYALGRLAEVADNAGVTGTAETVPPRSAAETGISSRLVVAPFVARTTRASTDREVDLTRLFLDGDPEGPQEARSPVAEADNFLRALDAGIEALDAGEPLDSDLLCRLHAILLEGVRGDSAHADSYRDRSVQVGTDPETDEARLVATPASNVPFRMAQLFDYLEAGGGYPDLLDAALLQYQFLTLHPFTDGNGRTSRLTLLLFLHTRGLLPTPCLYPTAYVEANREDHVERLGAVCRQGAWEAWIGFVLRGLREQAETAIETITELAALRAAYRRRVADADPLRREIVDSLFHSPVLTGSETATRLDCSESAVSSTLDRLAAEGVLDPVSADDSSAAVFVAPGVMDALDRE
jgi:Fic family protein